MSLPLKLAHRRYVQQAGWTAQLRRHVFAQTGLTNAQRVLEVGCGTGAVLQTISSRPRLGLFGLDIDLPALELAKEYAIGALLTGGDAHQLPYANGAFDITFCHFVLLWLHDPLHALQEMKRVTRKGGAVIAFAEPDYIGRVDPPAIKRLGEMQTEALRAQGADIELGHKLSILFKEAGFKNIETGILAAEKDPQSDGIDRDLELEVLRTDLAGRITENELGQLLSDESWAAIQVPTFYAWGRVF